MNNRGERNPRRKLPFESLPWKWPEWRRLLVVVRAFNRLYLQSSSGWWTPKSFPSPPRRAASCAARECCPFSFSWAVRPCRSVPNSAGSKKRGESVLDVQRRLNEKHSHNLTYEACEMARSYWGRRPFRGQGRNHQHNGRSGHCPISGWNQELGH
jgi:hypothetical protein